MPGLLFGGFIAYMIVAGMILESHPWLKNIVWIWFPIILLVAAIGGLVVLGFGLSNVRLVATQVMTLLLILLTLLARPDRSDEGLASLARSSGREAGLAATAPEAIAVTIPTAREFAVGVHR